ncbi:uncharacterized protein LOC125656168 isoform X2 [Ostrea edulis]|nr:uncharacterized protein LOC125656168 isoform X2 [Ostrea edulis]
MKAILEIAIVVTFWFSSASSAETKNSIATYTYGFQCYFGHQRLDDQSNVYLQYNGDPLLCDEISFLGQSAAHGIPYQLCLTPVYCRDPYCQVYVQYKSYATGEILQTLKCKNNHTQTWCSEKTDNIYVRIMMESSVRQWTEARIRIKLEAKPKNQIGAEKNDSHTRHAFFAILGILQIPIFIAIFRLVQQTAKRRTKILKAVNMERDATENADKPPSYYEATHPQTSTPTQAPPEYSDVVIKQQQSKLTQ